MARSFARVAEVQPLMSFYPGRERVSEGAIRSHDFLALLPCCASVEVREGVPPPRTLQQRQIEGSVCCVWVRRF